MGDTPSPFVAAGDRETAMVLLRMPTAKHVFAGASATLGVLGEGPSDSPPEWILIVWATYADSSTAQAEHILHVICGGDWRLPLGAQQRDGFVDRFGVTCDRWPGKPTRPWETISMSS
jgi:hypothetical protein